MMCPGGRNQLVVVVAATVKVESEDVVVAEMVEDADEDFLRIPQQLMTTKPPSAE